MPGGSPLVAVPYGEAIPYDPMRFATLVTVMFAAGVCLASGSVGLSSAPPYAGISLATAFSITVEGRRAEWAEYSRGRPVRDGVLEDAVAPQRWRLRYDPAGTTEWLMVDRSGVVVQRAKFEGLGPFVGRMPSALRLDAVGPGTDLTMDGVAIATESGSTGTRYITGHASPFELAGSVPPGRFTVVLLGTKSDAAGASLLPLAAVGALAASGRHGSDPDPVPEPSTICALAAAAGVALRRRLSGRRGRSVARPRPASSGRTRR